MRYVVFAVACVLLIGIVNASDIDFHVSIVGDGKLHPGDETIITLLIENEGKANNFVLNQNTSPLLQLITTAKDLRVEIDNTMIPIKVETVNPQIIGDLPSGRVAKAMFKVKVDEDAEIGTYSIPVRLKYTKVTFTQSSFGVILKYHEDEYDVDYLKIKVTKKDYDFSVKSVNSSLKTNQEGLVEVTVKNTGNNKIEDATLFINTTPPLRPNPKAMSFYLGDLDVDEEVKATFKVYVMDGALNSSYPATIILKFKTSSGRQYAIPKSIGLDVENRKTFTITKTYSLITSPKTIAKQFSMPKQSIPLQSMPLTMPQTFTKTSTQQTTSTVTIPSRGFVLINIKNVDADLKDVSAILRFDNPLIKVENTPYIKYFRKNEVKSLLFYVTSTAPPGNYGANVMLKHINKFGDEVISEKHYVEVEVKPFTPIRIVKIETENLAVGLKGNVNVILKNTLNRTINGATFFIISPDSAVTPLSSSSYISEIGPSESGTAKFRLEISDEALGGSYKLYLIERYSLGSIQDIVNIAEFSVIVNPKTAYFQIESIKSDLYPDATGDVIVKIKNAGNLAIYNAVVKLELSAPLTIAGGSSLSSLVGKAQPGLYFIGTLKPKEVATAKFRVDVGKDAGAGSYPVTITVEYYDSEGYMHTSNPITASIEVKEKPIITPLMAVAILLTLIALVVSIKFAKERIKRENRKKEH